MHRLGRSWLIIFCCLALSHALLAQTSAAQLDKLIDEKRYPELERMLTSAKLSPDERAYFEGILADRKRDAARAITLLERVLPALKKTTPRRGAEALRALGNDYFEVGRYSDAAEAYAELLHRYAKLFNKAQRQGFSDNLQTYNLLHGAPSQTVITGAKASIATTRDPIGDVDVPLTIGTSKEQWIFDTGANITTISLSTAKRLGITPSKGTASTQSGGTGIENTLHTGIIPEIRIGTAVILNVVALVMDDKNLDIPLGDKKHFQITGILGYPVLSQLGSFTYSDTDNELTIAPSAPSSAVSPRCVQMYVEELTPLIAAQVDGRELVFSFDTGGSSGSLTANYLRAFPQQFSALKKIKNSSSGAGGSRFSKAYQLPELHLQLGSATATVHSITVDTAPVGDGLLDKLYGNLGQALLNQFRSYTIDFGQMRLCVGEAK